MVFSVWTQDLKIRKNAVMTRHKIWSLKELVILQLQLNKRHKLHYAVQGSSGTEQDPGYSTVFHFRFKTFFF